MNRQTTCKGGGNGGKKKVFPLNTIKSSAVKLFSVPKAIYILDCWRNFLISRLSPHSLSIYQKIFPATSLIIPSLIICIISWVHYCLDPPDAAQHTPSSRGCPISCAAFKWRRLYKYEKAHLKKNLTLKLGRHLFIFVLPVYSLPLTCFHATLKNSSFSPFCPSLVVGQRAHMNIICNLQSHLGYKHSLWLWLPCC